MDVEVAVREAEVGLLLAKNVNFFQTSGDFFYAARGRLLSQQGA